MMKRSIALLSVAVIGLSAVVQAQSFSTVLDWMYQNGLTKYNVEADFRPNDNITRGEISKFFAKFAEVQGLSKSKTEGECQFSDLAGYDYTLVPTIIEACQYGLVKGSQGKYFPNQNLTEAEAITVVVRAVMGFQDETKTPWWTEYYNVGKWLGILQNETLMGLDTPASRSTVGTWLYRATLADQDALENEGTEELEDILEEIFGEDFFE